MKYTDKFRDPGGSLAAAGSNGGAGNRNGGKLPELSYLEKKQMLAKFRFYCEGGLSRDKAAKRLGFGITTIRKWEKEVNAK